jgi:hypothetical protein
MQRYELEAWLGDDHGLTAEQVTELLATAGDIEQRYPDPDDNDERQAALTTAYRLMTGYGQAIVDLNEQLMRARVEEARALAGIRQAALTLIRPGGRGIESEQGFALCVGVDRMTVRGWLGKR